MYSLHLPLVAVFLLSLVCADNTYYTIWPKDSSDKEANNRIRDDLNSRIGTDKIYASESATLGFLFWNQQLSADDVKHYADFPGVRLVSPPCNQPMDRSDIHNKCGVPFRALNTKPTLAGRAPPGTSTQPDSPDQLKVLSQAKDQALKDVEGFTYHETAGQDVRVYIIDSGVNLTHPDLKNLKEITDNNDPKAPGFEWMFPGPKPLTGQKNDAAPDSHGTCMSSMVAGITLGTAKKAQITMVKVPFTEEEESWTVERSIDALVQVYDDIILKVLKGKAVVSMSWGISEQLNKDYVNAFKAAYKYLIDALLEQDVLPVISAGQDLSAETNNPIDHYPALLARDEPRITVIGAVDNAGNPFEGGLYNNDIVKVSGPGDHLKCANRDGGYDDTVDGSSAPTAMTAGLLADFITGFPMTPATARLHLYGKAHDRTLGGRDVVYYNFDTADTDAAVMDGPSPSGIPR